MSTEKLNGLVTGVVLTIVVIGLMVGSYKMGKQFIVDQCLEQRAFVYEHEAWGCIRLRKRVHDVESGSYNQPEIEL